MGHSLEALAENGISIHSTIEDASAPEHIENLAGIICDQNDTIQSRFRLDSEDDCEAYTRTKLWQRLGKRERTNVEESAFSADRIRLEAEEIIAKGGSEKKWNDFFGAFFFKPLFDRCKIQREDSRHTRLRKLYSDSFEMEGERDWHLFHRGGGYRSRHRRELSMPRPDYACYFRIHNTSTTKMREPDCEVKTTPDYPHGDLVENFSIDVLKELASHGLFSCPVIKPAKRGYGSKGDFYRSNEMICFPWLVCELKKKEQKKETECHCQTASASSAAVMIMQAAARYAEPGANSEHVPPVVSITAIGPHVTVWITYLVPEDNQIDDVETEDEGSEGSVAGDAFEMVGIWTGDMTNVWDILALQAILENVHIWATQTLKPQIARYIGQWQENCREDSMSDSSSASSEISAQFASLRLRLDRLQAKVESRLQKDINV
ncbi:uncharacterized protein B0I36DRAFT_367249 [Microdochium trichocladiopsis]|uniref:Uncharacterized protein n=1 Tax=Microdochium trichocladiopsis TaxID=1682393 RepID=A0A9P8XV65_9PEZI|nr:uncharacterized protein B0I36DRAFT_367249 [Microdochium trichocladiopsis]KAH7020765.1 hypothetical protein B0I36DRAFT_367249 [Microdochium trichocladiopsis]